MDDFRPVVEETEKRARRAERARAKEEKRKEKRERKHKQDQVGTVHTSLIVIVHTSVILPCLHLTYSGVFTPQSSWRPQRHLTSELTLTSAFYCTPWGNFTCPAIVAQRQSVGLGIERYSVRIEIYRHC